MTTPPAILTLDEAERWYILGALRIHNGSISATARALGIYRSSLQRKLKNIRHAQALEEAARLRAEKQKERAIARALSRTR